MITQTQMR